jgi:phage tail-like protein
MAQFTVNPAHGDPFRNFKFRVKWDGKHVAGVSRVSGLKRTTEVVQLREAGSPSTTLKAPGSSKYEPVTLERGVSHDTAFEEWAGKVVQGDAASPANYRKDIVIELYNEAGQLALAYKVHRCWVSEYQALPDLDGNAHAVMLEHIKLENEGWERDVSVPAP